MTDTQNETLLDYRPVAVNVFNSLCAEGNRISPQKTTFTYNQLSPSLEAVEDKVKRLKGDAKKMKVEFQELNFLDDDALVNHDQIVEENILASSRKKFALDEKGIV